MRWKLPKLQATSGEVIEVPAFGTRGEGRGPWDVDMMFPKKLVGECDSSTIDEGSADLLYGLVRALRPRTVLETGTHKGRSARAIAEGLLHNQQGHLWTVDKDDYKLMYSGAIPEEAVPYVTQVVGETPAVFAEKLAHLDGIDFAHLDGDHERSGLEADLQFVRDHMDDECWVFVDNARDDMWPDVRDVLDELPEKSIQLATMCGADLIWMRRDDGKSQESTEES